MASNNLPKKKKSFVFSNTKRKNKGHKSHLEKCDWAIMPNREFRHPRIHTQFNENEFDPIRIHERCAYLSDDPEPYDVAGW